MSEEIVPQEQEEVKCAIEWCHEPAFRYGLCFDHFIEEEDARWDDQQAERLACLEGAGAR